jgi:hypothetical protein
MEGNFKRKEKKILTFFLAIVSPNALLEGGILNF